MHENVCDRNAQEIELKEQRIKDFLKEIADLKFMIQEIEMERNRLKENFDLKVNERNILGIIFRAVFAGPCECGDKLTGRRKSSTGA